MKPVLLQNNARPVTMSRISAIFNPNMSDAPDVKTSLARILRRVLLFFLLATMIPVAILRWLPPPASTMMVLARISALMEGDRDFHLNYRWTAWDDISPHAKLAVIAAEDQLFKAHPGFDFQAMEQAWRHNQRGKRLHGASTISQQTAKNLFLYSGRSYFRKSLEAYFTVLIELLWPKRRILEVYLNIAQFGKGIYGVPEASRIFFGKPASKLESREAALLAAVLPNPVLLRVDKPSPYVQRRRLWILRQMQQLGGTGYLLRLDIPPSPALSQGE
jgi:monofunctional biosynthetic peptidoglycan transglycosylase